MHVFLIRLFLTAEDYRLKYVPLVILDSLSESAENSWVSLFHLFTGHLPMLGPDDASHAARGLGQIRDYLIPDDLWSEVCTLQELVV